MQPLARIALAHFLAFPVAWLLARYWARRARDGSGVAPVRHRWLAATVAALSTACLAVLVESDAVLTDLFRTVPGLGADVYPTLAALALFLGPVPLTAFAAYRGAGDRSGSLAADGSGFLRGYAVVVGPALLLVALAPAIPDGWWLVAGVAFLGFLLAAATPVVLPRVVRTRSLTAAERRTLSVADPIPVRVVAAAGHRNALAAGLLPGLRAVYVTEALLEALPGEEAAAIVAHELGHHRRHHVALRLGAVALVVLPWLGATAAGIPWAFPAGLVLSVPGVLCVLALMRWTEYDADRYAARVAGPAALARGLDRLDDGTVGGLGARLAPHPPLTARIERVRGTAPPATRPSTSTD